MVLAPRHEGYGDEAGLRAESADSKAKPGNRANALPRCSPRTAASSNNAQLECLEDGARAVAHTKLGENIGNVVLHGAFGHS
jgi:hypothetical protein